MLKFLSFGFLSGTPKEDVMKNIGDMMSNQIKEKDDEDIVSSQIKNKGDEMVFGKSSVEEVSPPQMNGMSRMDELNSVLSELQTASGDIDACAVVSEDGLTMASSLPAHMEETSVSSMCAVMISMGQRISVELSRGSVEQLFVKGEAGMVISQYAGEHAVLMVLARKDAKLGLIFYDISRAAKRVQQILS